MVKELPVRTRFGGWSLMRQCATGALLAAVALAPLPAAAQQQDHALMRGEILDSMVIENEADMNFGDIIPGATNGTVVMTPSASPLCTPINGIVRTGPCQAARFDGDVSFLFYLRVTKPVGNQITLTGPNGATMLLNNFTFDMATASLSLGQTTTEQRFLILTGNGNFTLYVGGTLHVASTQRPGIYNGSFALTFNYD